MWVVTLNRLYVGIEAVIAVFQSESDANAWCAENEVVIPDMFWKVVEVPFVESKDRRRDSESER